MPCIATFRSACSVRASRNSRTRPTNTAWSTVSSSRWTCMPSCCGIGIRESALARRFIVQGRHEMANLNRLSATEAAGKLATREITAQALVADCIERIREREPVVHAWTHLDFDGAMARARQLDAMPAKGLLHGLPIAVKDVFDTFDMPTRE